MNIQAKFQTRDYDFSQKVFLYLLLIGSGVIMFIPVAWLNYKIKLGLGVNISQMALTYQVVFLLAFVAIGFFLAFLIELSIRGQKAIFSSSQAGNWSARIAYWWGFEQLSEAEPSSLKDGSAGEKGGLFCFKSINGIILSVSDKAIRSIRYRYQVNNTLREMYGTSLCFMYKKLRVSSYFVHTA